MKFKKTPLTEDYTKPQTEYHGVYYDRYVEKRAVFVGKGEIYIEILKKPDGNASVLMIGDKGNKVTAEGACEFVEEVIRRNAGFHITPETAEEIRKGSRVSRKRHAGRRIE